MQNWPPFLINPVTIKELTSTAAPACADPGIFVRGGRGQSDKKALDNAFFIYFI